MDQLIYCNREVDLCKAIHMIWINLYNATEKLIYVRYNIEALETYSLNSNFGGVWLLKLEVIFGDSDEPKSL